MTKAKFICSFDTSTAEIQIQVKNFDNLKKK